MIQIKSIIKENNSGSRHRKILPANFQKGCIKMTDNNKAVNRSNSLRGVVLIMVVTVMFMLIILLLATLTVVSTAQNRYYIKYEENQAYYSARSALDIFRESLMNDNTYVAYDSSGNARKYEYTDYSGATPVDKTGSSAPDMTQGRALELDLYSITAQNDIGILSNIVKNDHVFGGASANKDDENFSIEKASRSSNIGSGTYTDGEFYKYYKIKLPSVSDGSKAYGVFCDNDEAIIKVEVLTRRYDTDGKFDSFTDAQIASLTNGGASSLPNPNAGDPPLTLNDLKESIKNGSRSKDQMRLRITSTTTFLGTEGKAIVEYNVKEGIDPKTENALTATGAYSSGGGANFNPAGGASTLNPSVSVIGDGNTTAGEIYSKGSFLFKSSSKYTLNEGEGIYADGDVMFENCSSPTNIESFGSNNIIYAKGAYCPRGSSGTVSHPINVVCNEMKFQFTYSYVNDSGATVSGGQTNSDVTHYGNIAANKVDFTGSNNLNVNGTIYTNELIVPTSIDGHDFRIGIGNNNIVLCKGGKITSLTDGSSYTLDDLTAMALTVKPSGQAGGINNDSTGTVTSDESVEFDALSYVPVTDNERTFKNLNKLPSAVGSVKIPTAQAMFKDFFDEGSFDTDGELIGGYADANIASKSISAEKDLNATNAAMFPTQSLNVFSTNAPVSGQVVSGSGLLPQMNGGNPYNLTFDTSGGDMYIQLVPGAQYGGTWSVTGSGTLNIIMPEGSGNKYKFNNCRIESDDIKSSTASITNGTTKAAKIHYYCGSGAEVETSNGCFFAGYFYMPTASLYLQNGSGTTVSYKGTPSATATNVGNSGVVGSVICGKFASQVQVGIVYLDENSGKEDPGKTTFDWSTHQFMANAG